MDDELIISILEGRDYVRNGKYVVKQIGSTTYISFDDLSPLEIISIGEIKKEILEFC